jgi:HK97 gp10 family phage protein
MAIRSRTLLRSTETVSISGFDEVKAGLKQLARATERNVLKRSATKAMEPMVAVAKDYAPVKSGRLRSAIHLSVGFDDPDFRKRARAAFVATGSAAGVKRTKGGGMVLAQIKVGGRAGLEHGEGAPYANLIELGTVRIAAHPFLRPAFDSKHAEALALLRDSLTVEVRKAVARRARKLAKVAAAAA